MPAIMTLEQVKQLTHAFDEFTTVENSNLPEYYRGIFPRKCECGGEIILSIDNETQGGFTQLQCCNPDCWVKMAHRFAYFVKAMGYKGFGATSAMPLFRAAYPQFKYPTFLNIFLIDPTIIRQYLGDADADAFAMMKAELHESAFQFKDAIAALGIPDLGKGSKLFDFIKSPNMILYYVAKEKTDELCDLVGIQAPKSRYFLKIHGIDIITLLCDVVPHLISTPKRDINIAITGSVTVDGQSLTRSEFIWKCEALRDKNGAPAHKLVETKARAKLEYVIADAPSGSSKYSLGQELGILITAQEFYDMLRTSLESEGGEVAGDVGETDDSGENIKPLNFDDSSTSATPSLGMEE